MTSSTTTPYKGMNAVNGASSRTVLITGVGKGLGRALALELAERGHTVIGCARTQDRLNSLQSNQTSLTPPTTTSSSMLTGKEFQRTNIKVVPLKNAGTVNENNKICQYVKGIANMLRHFIALMLTRNRGIIVNMSSGCNKN
ncbi:nadph-dependent pterin aldehyde reductase [Quercus suber]|uniref:Nadph-dependent pterin aldehyde reductase n=1 Tax=Quercus suber TaxID=58331 RepID=A0AAW0ITQ6_QUESU